EEGQKKKAEDEAKQRKRAEEEEDRANRLLYAERLALAQSYWEEGEVAAAREKLDEAQAHRDTWEHRYLSTLMNHRGQRTLMGHTRAVLSVCFSPDGKRLASGSEDSTLKEWDAATGRNLRTLTGHQGGVFSLSFSPDGKRIASGSWVPYNPGELKLWEATTG